jgi:hypothetical protein
MADNEAGQRRPKRQVPIPPKMTKAEWAKRDKTSVTFTRGEPEHISQLIAAGKVLLRDGRSVSPQLKAALSRLGISTQGL